MAEPLDSAFTLDDATALVQQQYFPELVEEYPGRFGMILNRIFKPYKEEITGDGKTLQVETSPADTVRASTSPLGAMAAPDAFQTSTIKVRFSQTTTANDFTKFSAAAQVTDIDVKEAGKGSIVDLVKRIAQQVIPNYDEHTAILNHLPRTALIGTVAATPKQNDNFTISSCTATASNTAGMRFYMTNGSPAAIRRGTRLDFINPSTGVVNAGNVLVTDTAPGDPTGPSFGVEFVSSGITAKISTGNLANVANADQIYFSGEKNAGIYGLGAYFGRPAATGDSFIGAVDRMAKGYRWMNPTATREGSSSAIVTASHFDDLQVAMGFRVEAGQNGMVIMTDPKIAQKLRNEVFQSVVIQQPLDDSSAKRFANFGSVGLNYQSPQFGTVKIMADPLCPPNTIRLIDPETWKYLFYGFRGLQPVIENGGQWYRMNENTPNTGRSLIWKADWYSLQTGWCTKPWLNGSILNVTAS